MLVGQWDLSRESEAGDRHKSPWEGALQIVNFLMGVLGLVWGHTER